MGPHAIDDPTPTKPPLPAGKAQVVQLSITSSDTRSTDSVRPTAPHRVRVSRYMRYYTASDGSTVAASKLGVRMRPAPGRRRVPTGNCHAVPWWSPARALCGRLTELMALFPKIDFETQRVQICPECLALVRAEFETEPDGTATHSTPVGRQQ